MRVEKPKRRAADETPSARPRHGIDACLLAANSNRTCLDPLARRGKTRRMQFFGQAAEIGKTRRETDHIDTIFSGCVQVYQGGRRHFLHVRQFLQVKPDRSAINHRNIEASGRNAVHRQRHQAPVQLPVKRMAANDGRIIDDHEGPVGRHQLLDAFHRRCREICRKCDDALAHRFIDGIGEFNGQGAVTTSKNARKFAAHRLHSLTSTHANSILPPILPCYFSIPIVCQ